MNSWSFDSPTALPPAALALATMSSTSLTLAQESASSTSELRVPSATARVHLDLAYLDDTSFRHVPGIEVYLFHLDRTEA